MNKIEEIYKESFPYDLPMNPTGHDEDYIKSVLRNTWNLAIREAADNADADFNMLGPPKQDGTGFVYDIEVYVLKGSILKLLINERGKRVRE